MTLPRPLISNLLILSRLLLGSLFIYSGFSKLVRPLEYFQAVIHMYSLFPDAIVPAISFVVPWTELILGTFLLLGYRISWSAGGLVVLTAGFQLVLAQALLRNLKIDECGCFGGGLVKLSLLQSFILDTAILLILIQIATAKISDHRVALDKLLKNP